MTTTVELIDWLNVESKLASGDGSPIAASRLRDSAQRLRELDKPDCVWTNDDKRVDSYITGCNKRENVRWSPYCFNCGGAVKDGNA